MAKTKTLDAHLRKDKKSKVYQATFKTKSGAPVERTTRTKNKAEARKILDQSRVVEIETAAKANLLTAEAITAIMADRKVTCETAIAEWAAWRATFSSANTVRTQEMLLRNFCEETGCAKKPVNYITFEHANDFVNGQDAGKRTNREQRLTTLRSFFRFLSAKAYYVGDPTLLVKVRYAAMSHEQKEITERVPFTEREFNHVLAHTEGFWKWATALSYWAGLRLSDICCLEWSSILPKEIVVWVRKGDTRVALPLGNPLIGGGKLSLILMEVMTEHNVHSQYVFPSERLIVTDPTKRARLSVYYNRILERLGIEGKSFHCLRHAFATRLDAAGKTIEDIGRALGHTPASTKSGVTAGYVHKKK
jgi:integrase